MVDIRMEKINMLLDHFTHLKRTLDNLRLERLRSTTPGDSDLERISASDRNIHLLLPEICTTSRGRQALLQWRKQSIPNFRELFEDDDEVANDMGEDDCDQTTLRLEYVLEELLVYVFVFLFCGKKQDE